MTLLAVCFLPLAAWQVRNDMLTGYGGFSAIAEWNLYFYQGLSIVAHQSGKPITQVRSEMGQGDDRLFQSLHPELRDAGPAAKLRYLRARESGYCSRILSPMPESTPRGPRRWFSIRGRISCSPLSTAAPKKACRPCRTTSADSSSDGHFEWLWGWFTVPALGLFAAWRRLSWQWIVVLVTLAYFLAISGGPTGYARMRHPVMPVICVFAGYGIVALLSRLRGMRQAEPRQSCCWRPSFLPESRPLL